jgi:5-methylcytosine-specific restriction endonuclease McrA
MTTKITIEFEKIYCPTCRTCFVPKRIKQFHCSSKCYSHYYGQIRDKTKKKLYERIRESRIRSSGKGNFTIQQWNDLVKRHKNICPCCKKLTKEFTVDHIIPISKGGTNNIENIQPLCRKCNVTKGNRFTKKYEI